MPVQAPRRLFTVDEFHQMACAGIFGEDDRVELLAGEIVEMTPIGSRHAACVSRLNHLLTERLGAAVIVRVQDPLTLDDYSEPEPDIAVVRKRADFYRDAHPTPADTLLVIEVAETSGPTDRGDKVPLYARAGIPEVWVVDLPEQAVDVYRQPSHEGYRGHRRMAGEEALSATTVSGLDLSLSDVLT